MDGLEPVIGAAVSTSTVVRVRWRISASDPLSTVRPARMIVTRASSATTAVLAPSGVPLSLARWGRTAVC